MFHEQAEGHLAPLERELRALNGALSCSLDPNNSGRHPLLLIDGLDNLRVPALRMVEAVIRLRFGKKSASTIFYANGALIWVWVCVGVCGCAVWQWVGVSISQLPMHSRSSISQTHKTSRRVVFAQHVRP